MVKVNLLSPGSSKEVTENVTKIFSKVTLALVILAVFFFSVGVLLSLANIYRSKGLPLINQQYYQAENFAKKISELKNEKGALTVKLNFLDKYLQRDITWSEKLSELRNIIPNAVWLRQLSFEKIENKDKTTGKLYLKGGLVGMNNVAPLEVLSVLVEQLQKDKAFSAGLENPILTDSRKETYNNAEILTFAIEIPLKSEI